MEKPTVPRRASTAHKPYAATAGVIVRIATLNHLICVVGGGFDICLNKKWRKNDNAK